MTMVLFDALIGVNQHFTHTWESEDRFVSVAPEITPIIEPGIPDTNGTSHF